MRHSSRPLLVLEVDAQGLGPDGEEFDVFADQDHVDAGYLVNQTVAIRFPDGTVSEGNRVLVTPEGMDWMVEEFATPEGKADWNRKKAERERKLAEAEQQIEKCDATIKHLEFLWAETLCQMENTGKIFDEAWSEVVERDGVRRSRLLWCRVLVDDVQRAPDKVAEWAKEQVTEARAELEAEKRRIADLEASPEMAEVKQKLRQYAEQLKSIGHEAAFAAVFGRQKAA